ncbi:hypothetical protein [Acinetobacter sp. WZC-1]|uniref:hypothetical protein n=1 Tax=Acinetobacter sp. WZC-1 TaxID=3459034 RepID=UPI00403DD787
MLISRDIFLKSKLFHIEFMLSMFVWIIVLTVLVTGSAALFRPVKSGQYQNVVLLSGQATYPATQHMAKQLLNRQRIHRAEYFKLMQAYQAESSRVRQYPAMAKEDQ